MRAEKSRFLMLPSVALVASLQIWSALYKMLPLLCSPMLTSLKEQGYGLIDCTSPLRIDNE